MDKNATCPSCMSPIRMDGPPTDGPDTPGEAWICFKRPKCSDVVCVNCYVQHNERRHPEVYRCS